MEGLLVLLGLAVLGIPVAVVYLLVSQRSVRRGLRDLQARLETLETGLEEPLGTMTSRVKRSPDAIDIDATPPNTATSSESSAGPRTASAPEFSETPEDAETPPPSPVPRTSKDTTEPPKAVVMRSDNFRRLGAWLTGNWFYVVSAVSLALAGIFLVQYGVENGLLPPRTRVIAAILFGAALITTGELIRRRYGDDDGATTANLPSVFSAAGIVTLFGGILAARVLYDLIGPEAALAGMVAVAVVALVLGWYYGPILAAVGITGAFAAPFLVGGTTDDPSWLYGFFAVSVALGLGIDTVRRWAWITVLTLVLAYAAGSLVVLGEPATGGAFGLFLTAVAVLAILVPVRSIVPEHNGTMIAETLSKTPEMPWPEFPTRVAFAAMLATSAGLSWVSAAGVTEFWLATALLTVLSALAILWSLRGAALQDVALLPVIGLVSALTLQGSDRLEVWRLFQATYEENPEATFPLEVTELLAMAVVISVFALWRALVSRGSEVRFGLVWASTAALLAPIAAACLELVWIPAKVIGAYPWALHAVAIAALMVVFAERLARVDSPEDRLRMSLPVLSALSALAFAFTILFADTALTLAFVATVVAAAALDRAFRMPVMTAFITVGVVTIGYRLVADPGLDFAINGPLAEVIVIYGGALGGFVASLVLLSLLTRLSAKAVLDSAAWATGGLLLSILLFRWLEMLSGQQDASHWAMGLYAVIWLGFMAAQLQRLELGGLLRYARIALAAVFGLIGFGAIILALTILNPVFSDWSGEVLGPPVLNTLAVAYLLPALLLAATAFRINSLNKSIRTSVVVVTVALAAFWVVAAIRHFWQGAEGMVIDRGMTQPELYSYTVALLLAGAGLFYQSLARRSHLMRRVGLAVISLAVAKVFLVDASGLTGLTRVFSFLLLGLALAGLALLGRWAERSGQGASE